MCEYECDVTFINAKLHLKENLYLSVGLQI